MARYVKKRSELRKRARERRLREARKWLLQLAIVGVALLVALGALAAATRNWPPLVVVESGSMQRAPGESSLGRIDTGDIVLVSKVDSRADVTTYVAGRARGYSTYGDYGDVIVYRALCIDGRTPVIHRAILWLDWDSAAASWNASELALLPPGSWARSDGKPGAGGIPPGTRLTIRGVGASSSDLVIDLSSMLRISGFVTKGDNPSTNPLVDQEYHSISYHTPVEARCVNGVARGELGGIGLLKVYLSGAPGASSAPAAQVATLVAALVLLFGVPFAYDRWKTGLRRRKVARGELEEDEEMEDPIVTALRKRLRRSKSRRRRSRAYRSAE